jgi:dTDP-glucose 4,6-dehydratase
LLRILLRGASNRAYNVGSDEAISIAALAAAVAHVADIARPDIRIQGTRFQDSTTEYYVPDITRAQNELDLAITIPFSEALRRTIAWYYPLLTRPPA